MPTLAPSGPSSDPTATQSPSRLLRQPEVLERLGLKRSWFRELVKMGALPQPVKIGARAIAWKSDEIDEAIRLMEAGRFSARVKQCLGKAGG